MKTVYTFLVALFPIFIACGNNNAKELGRENETINNLAIALDSTAQLAESTLREISITAVGDIMLGSGYPSVTNLPPNDGKNSFDAVANYLNGDIVFGNLEGCFLNSGESSKCKYSKPGSCYAFRMPESYGNIIKDAGFNVLSIANNHVGDFDNKGRKKTMEVLDALQINYAGQTNCPYALFEENGIKYAFCAFAPNENTLSINKIDSAKILVKELKSKADIVIVSFHGGAEGTTHERVPKRNEIFFNENRGNVYAFAHGVIDAGADVVLGHGPHVTRAVEVYKNKFIAYSLGNFCTYGMFNLKGPNGFAPLIQLKINKEGDFIKADIISIKQDKVNGLQLDETYAAFNRMQYLTDLDFPDHHLLFKDNSITLKESR